MDTNKETRQNEGTVVVTAKVEAKKGIIAKLVDAGKKCGRAIKRAAKTKVGKAVAIVGGMAATGYVGYKMGQNSSVPAQITIKTEVPEEEPAEETPVEEPELGEIQENLDTELSEL